VINLDTSELEVFRGFNQKPLAASERFASLPKHEDGDYHPVRHVTSIPFKEIRKAPNVAALMSSISAAVDAQREAEEATQEVTQ
jgi:hypothetical protein